MMKLLGWALLFVGAAARADVTDDVRCREIHFSESAQARDLESFTAFIDADARFVGDGVRRGPAEIAEAWSLFMTADGPAIRWRPQFVEVLEDGKLALTRGPYRMTVTDEQGTQTDYWGTFNSVWRLNDDGQWRIVFDTGDTAVREPPAEQLQELLEADNDCSK